MSFLLSVSFPSFLLRWITMKCNVCVLVGPGTGLVPTAWQTVMKSHPAQVHQTRTTPPNSPVTLLEPRGEVSEDLYDFLACSLLVHPLTLSFLCPKKLGRRPQTQQDYALRGQDRQVQILPESHRDGVHQKEDGGGVQHSPAAHRGAAGAPGNTGCQHPSSTHWQDMVRGKKGLCVLLSFVMANDHLMCKGHVLLCATLRGRVNY